MSHITTHVLDAALGHPAAGVPVALFANGELVAEGTTDADGRVVFDREAKPGVANLLTIFSVLGDIPVATLEADFEGRGYGDLKKALVELVESVLGPVRERTRELLADPAELDRILTANAERADEVASATLAEVYDKVGFLPRLG